MPTLNPSYGPLYDQPGTVLNLDRVACWNVYNRLKELDIPCQCSVNSPLTVTIESPIMLFQVWSVINACTAPRANLVNHLNRCWQQRVTS